MIELSERKREVLHWIAMGKTNDEIAIILGLSSGTIKKHVEQIVRYYGIHSTNSRLLIPVYGIIYGDLDTRKLTIKRKPRR